MAVIRGARRSYNARQIYDAIVSYIDDHDLPPTLRELMDMTGIKSLATARDWLHRLRDDGLIDFRDGQPRTIRVIAAWPDDDRHED